MISTLLARVASALGGRAGVIAVAFCVMVLVVMAFTARFMIRTIEDQAVKIVELRTELETEKQQRQQDVTGLTTLVDGLVVDNRNNEQDQRAIDYAIDQATPQPLTPFMRAYFECLRKHRDGSEDCASVAADTGTPSGTD